MVETRAALPTKLANNFPSAAIHKNFSRKRHQSKAVVSEEANLKRAAGPPVRELTTFMFRRLRDQMIDEHRRPGSFFLAFLTIPSILVLILTMIIEANTEDVERSGEASNGGTALGNAADANQYGPGPDGNPPISLSAFFSLPVELQQRIISLACRSADSSHPSQQLALHYPTVFNLLCASRTLNDLAIPVLYAHIRASKPSKLLGLYKTLLIHPERGALIKSLHLGPDDELPPSHWPLRHRLEDEEKGYPLDRGVIWLQTSLQDAESTGGPGEDGSGGSLAPRWCQPNHQICLDNPRPICQGYALHQATRRALSALDVDPYKRASGWYRSNIGLVRVNAVE